jgi:hypothetical protein
MHRMCEPRGSRVTNALEVVITSSYFRTSEEGASGTKTREDAFRLSTPVHANQLRICIKEMRFVYASRKMQDAVHVRSRGGYWKSEDDVLNVPELDNGGAHQPPRTTEMWRRGININVQNSRFLSWTSFEDM